MCWIVDGAGKEYRSAGKSLWRVGGCNRGSGCEKERVLGGSNAISYKLDFTFRVKRA